MKKKIVAIGDSLTYGFPFSPRFSWVHIASQEIGVEIVNKGVCGETTEDMILRFQPDVLELKPGYAIITGGTNDAFMDTAPQEVGENIRLMLDSVKQNGTIPLIGLPPPVDFPEAEALLREYRTLILAIAAANQVRWIDFYGAMVDQATGGLRRDMNLDGAHPNEFGYKMMAAVAVQVLSDCISC